MELVLIALILSGFVGWLASERGRSGIGWFFLSLLVSPILAGIGLLVVGRKD